MIVCAGIDLGSTYTKSIILGENDEIVGRSMVNTGFKLGHTAERAFQIAIGEAGLEKKDIFYIISTGYSRYQVDFRDLNITDLTAAARGSRYFFPNTATVLDIGGQTMKAMRLDENSRIKSFRLNDK